MAEVQDQNGDSLSGVTVTFAVTIGGGSISASSVTTNASGQAETTLTLGTTAGSNRVVASVSGITQTRNFNATGQAAVATTIVEISGDGQAGDAGATLNDPFIVEVRDQDGDALSGVAVAFAVTGGGGSLSACVCDNGCEWTSGIHPDARRNDYEYSDGNCKRYHYAYHLHSNRSSLFEFRDWDD